VTSEEDTKKLIIKIRAVNLIGTAKIKPKKNAFKMVEIYL